MMLNYTDNFTSAWVLLSVPFALLVLSFFRSLNSSALSATASVEIYLKYFAFSIVAC